MFNAKTRTMTGTSGASFNVVAVLALGAIGYRSLGGDQYRVRAEVGDNIVEFPAGWTSPDYAQKRHSIVVTGQQALLEAVATAAAILGDGSAEEPKAPVLIEIGGDSIELSFEEARVLNEQLSAYLAAA